MKIWRLIAPFALSGACTPLGNLDATGRGAARSSAGAANTSGAGATSSAAGAGSTVNVDEPAGSGSTSGEPYASPPDAEAGGPAAGGQANSGGAASPPSTAGSELGGGGTAGSELGGGGSLDAGAPGDAGAFGEVAGDLPNDQPGSPVQGNLSCFEASYSGDASFEVRTPTATYVVLRNRGNIISITDALSTQHPQWIGYSDYRPRRVTGVFASHLPQVITTLDADSLTARHARLRCESATKDWLWFWDFYATQATLTVSRAPESIGFTYRGTPGGQLDDADRLVLASGQMRSVQNPFFDALPGSTGWLYFADPTLGHSLFLIQHGQDDLPERYEPLEGDSATWVFGDGKITRLPKRFSLGLVDSTNHAAVTKRAEFVITAVH